MFGLKPKSQKNTATPNQPTGVPAEQQPAKEKKPGLFSSILGKGKPRSTIETAKFDPQTGIAQHTVIETKFQRMKFFEKHAFGIQRSVFVVMGLIFFAVVFYLGYLGVRAVLPKPDSDHDGVSDGLDLCPGYDDSVDQDHDKIPDGCDKAVTPGDFSDITFQNTTLLAVSDKVYDVIFTIHDANKTWGVTNLRYKVELLSASGETLKSHVNVSYVNPGSDTIIVEPNLSTSNAATQVQISLISGDFAASVSTQSIPLTIRNRTFTPRTSDGIAVFTGVLQNNSNFALNVSNVTMIVKDATGKIISDNVAKINTLKPSENRYFELHFPTSLDPSVTYEITANTNGMDQANLIPPTGGQVQF